MSRGAVDMEGLTSPEVQTLRSQHRPCGLGFDITRIGHVAVRVRDLARSVEFYTQVLGFEVSDVYPETMMPGGMAFLRCNPDHHGIALVGGADAPVPDGGLHHVAFEVGTLDEVIRARDHLRALQVPIEFEGRRRAGCQVAVEFLDPDGHHLEIYWCIDQIGSEGQARPPEQWRQALSLEAALADPPLGQDTTLHDPTLRP